MPTTEKDFLSIYDRDRDIYNHRNLCGFVKRVSRYVDNNRKFVEQETQATYAEMVNHLHVQHPQLFGAPPKDEPPRLKEVPNVLQEPNGFKRMCRDAGLVLWVFDEKDKETISAFC